jgi:hypothetical protein
MPRNTAGGSGHKSQRNSEGSKARNNRTLIDDYLDDIRNGESTKGLYIGRILKRMGSGRMQVFYITENKTAKEQIIVMRGGLRGKAKKTVWVDVDSIVLIAETGLSGMTHEIVGVFSDSHVGLYRKLNPDADTRLFLKTAPTGEQTKQEDDDLFETAETSSEDEEVDVDDI